MEYLITFAEGLLTFISPCLLPMLPIYLSYLAGSIEGSQSEGVAKNKRMLTNALGFVLGFSAVFILMGAAAGTVGRFALQHTRLLNIVGGSLMVLLGLNYMDVIKIPFLNAVKRMDYQAKTVSVASSLLLGAVFALGWTPCVGAFLGSALMLAASGQTAFKGVLLLTAYSLGLGVPFILSAVLIKQLSGMFSFIKRHYKIINIVSGGLLVLLGVLMMFGALNAAIGLLSK